MPLGNPITIENESRTITVVAESTNNVFDIEGGYKVNHINVYQNGVRLIPGDDFLANNGLTVQLIGAPYIGDTLTFHIFDEFFVNDAIVGAASSQTIYGDLVINGVLYANNDVTISYSNKAGIATYAHNAGIATYAEIAGIATYAHNAGIATYAETAGIATYAHNAGIATYALNAGIATYADTAGIATNASGLTGTPDIIINTLTATTATFSGDVTVLGTLTYEDVTEVDVVGIITARSGIHIPGGSIDDTYPDGQIHYDNNSLFFEAGLPGTPGAHLNAGGFSVDGQNNHIGLVTAYSASMELDANNTGISAFHDKCNYANASGSVEKVSFNASPRQLSFSPGDTGQYIAFKSNVDFDAISGDTLCYSFYGDGTAPSYFGGNVGIKTLTPNHELEVDGDSKFKGSISVDEGTDLDGYKIEGGSIDGATGLNGLFVYNLEDGHIQKYTNATTGNYNPNFRVSATKTLNSVMDVGDVATITLMVASGSHYLDAPNIQIDGSVLNLDIDYANGVAPAAPYGQGYDIYSFIIQKTAATPAYHIVVTSLGVS